MELLVDSQSLLWMRTHRARFSAETVRLLVDPGTVVWASVASFWEVAIKYSIGKLPLPTHPREFFPRLIQDNMVRPLPLELRDAILVADLPYHHRDPFDRLILAQALNRDLPLLSSDDKFARYGVRLIRP